MADTPPEDIIPGKDKVRGVTHTHTIYTANYQSSPVPFKPVGLVLLDLL